MDEGGECERRGLSKERGGDRGETGRGGEGWWEETCKRVSVEDLLRGNVMVSERDG